MWKTLKTRRQLQQLLGKINWYRKFVPNLSEKLHPHDLKLKNKNNKIEICDTENEIIKDIHKYICNKAYLYIPDIIKEFGIHCDASEHAIGGLLSQENGIIDHYSKRLNEAQMKYIIVEKEMYAIYMSISKWRSLIGGSKIKVFTDNQNLL
ncbi:Transposon Tf2-8 polyprotein [Dictyocoela muelleri]|nr:Transposon Tf2-8 polyprotein [Dictyocoela muelleri]